MTSELQTIAKAWLQIKQRSLHGPWLLFVGCHAQAESGWRRPHQDMCSQQFAEGSKQDSVKVVGKSNAIMQYGTAKLERILASVGGWH